MKKEEAKIVKKIVAALDKCWDEKEVIRVLRAVAALLDGRWWVEN